MCGSGRSCDGTDSKPEDTTVIRIAAVILRDGTRVWGLLERESADSLVIADFNTGRLSFGKNQVKSTDISALQGDAIIETVNGTSYFGEIMGLENGLVTVRSAVLGVLKIESNTLLKITSSNAYVSRRGSVWFTNPNATRYFFAPSAIPLKKREGYFQNAYLLANSANVGINNYLTVGGGVVIPLLFYVTPKISFKAAKNLYLGAGILFTQSFFSEFRLSAGIGYGLATYGTLDHNMTLGAGYGYAMFNEDYKATPLPIVTINGMTRIGKKLSLVTENWLIPRAGYNRETSGTDIYGQPIFETHYENKEFYSAAVSLGLRLMPGIRTSVDFSIVGIRPNPDQSNLVLPYLDFVYKFN